MRPCLLLTCLSLAMALSTLAKPLEETLQEYNPMSEVTLLQQKLELGKGRDLILALGHRLVDAVAGAELLAMDAVQTPTTAAVPVDTITCTVVQRGGTALMPDMLNCAGQAFSPDNGYSVGSHLWWVSFTSCCVCIIIAALAAGLTMGLVSIDVFDLDLLLEMKSVELPKNVDAKELYEDQYYASRLRPLMAGNFFRESLMGGVPEHLDPSNKHYMLVTLLITNAVANEALPVFLGQIVPSWAAILISVSFVLIFGEIIPSAVFTGSKGMGIASSLAGCVAFLKILLIPVVWPISLVLDACLVHEDTSRFHRGKLKALVRLQGKCNSDMSDVSIEADSFLHEDEVDMVHGSLSLNMKKVQAMEEQWENAKMLPLTAVLDANTLADICHWGHSRLFVYDGDMRNIRGLLMVNKLILINPGDKRPLKDLALRKPIVVGPQDSCLMVLNHFQTGRSHLAVISPDPPAVLKAWADNVPIPEHAWPTGFLTMGNIFEEILQDVVFDEGDREAAISCLSKADKMARLHSWADRARRNVQKRHEDLASRKELERQKSSSSTSPPFKAPGLAPKKR